MKIEEDIRKKIGGGVKLLIVFCILMIEGLSVYREHARQHAFETIDETGTYMYLGREETWQSGNGYIREKQMFFDLSADTDGQFSSREFPVFSGEYRVTLFSDHGEWMDAPAYAYSFENRFSLNSEQVVCSSWENEKSFYVLASHSVRDLQIRFNSEEAEIGTIRTRIERIDRTGWFLVRALLIDGMGIILYLGLRYFRKKKFSDEQGIAIGVLGAGFLLAILPVLGAGLIDGHDLIFHLWRIEGLKESLLNGTLNPKVYGSLLNGYGYASGALYADSFLYIPALLRAAGMTMSGSYKAFIVIMTALAMGVSYHVLKKISGRRDMGAACSVLYVLSASCMMDWHLRAAVGGAVANVFMPLIFGALWLLYQEKEDEGKRAMWWLVIGATGVMQSHILTTFVIALVAAGVLVLGFRRYFKKNNFLILLKALGWILLFNASFLVPFIDYYLTEKLNINTLYTGIAQLQSRAGDIQEMLEYHVTGDLVRTVYTLWGGSFLMMALLYGVYRAWSSATRERRDRFENIALAGCGVGFLLCTRYFPWDFLSKHISLFNFLAKTIQFPFRFRTVTTFLMVLLVCLMLKKVLQKSQAAYFGLSAVMLVVSVTGAFELQRAFYEQNERKIYIEETAIMSDRLIELLGSGMEYLPAEAGIDAGALHDSPLSDDRLIDEAQIVEAVERVQNRFRITVHNQNDAESTIELPVLCYKGYIAYDEAAKERFFVDMGTNGRVRVKIPAGYQGTVRVEFRDRWYWNVAEIITALTWICAVLLAAKRHGWGDRLKKWKNKGLSWKKDGRESNTK